MSEAGHVVYYLLSQPTVLFLEASHSPTWPWKQFELATTLSLEVQGKLLGGNDI